MRIDSAITVNTRPGRRIRVMIQILDHHAYSNRIVVREVDCACLRFLEFAIASCLEEVGSWANDCFVNTVLIFAARNNEIRVVARLEKVYECFALSALKSHGGCAALR